MCRSIVFSRIILSAMALLPVAVCLAQPATGIGLNGVVERTLPGDKLPAVGATFEQPFGKHHGLETGICYSVFKLQNRLYVDGALYGYYVIKEQYVSVPVLYKFYSSLLNFSAGPSFDLYTGWKEAGGSLPVRNPTHNAAQKFQTGLLCKVSKSIPLMNHFLIEPEIRYNRIFSSRKYNYGLGLAAKYTL